MHQLAQILISSPVDSMAPVNPAVLLFAFLICHAIADYPLQGKFLAIRKDRHIKVADFAGDTPNSIWVYCLSAHSLVHAGGVWLILAGFRLPHAVAFAIAEFFLHWIIDFAKCERWTNFHADQSLHMLCKICYIVILVTQSQA